MPTPDDSFTLPTAENVVLDGANGVGHAPRLHFPHAVESLLASGVALAVVAVLLRQKARRPLAVAALLALAAIPGVVTVVALRADSPLRRAEMASTIRTSLETLKSEMPWPQTAVQVVHEDDDVLDPLLTYTLPTRPDVEAGALKLQMHGTRLKVLCRREDPVHLFCESAP